MRRERGAASSPQPARAERRRCARIPAHPANARRAVEGLKIAPLLGAYRGRGALDVDAAVDVIVRLGWLAHELAGSAGRDFEIEVNPLKLRQQGQGAVAVDARARIGQA